MFQAFWLKPFVRAIHYEAERRVPFRYKLLNQDLFDSHANYIFIVWFWIYSDKVV